MKSFFAALALAATAAAQPTVQVQAKEVQVERYEVRQGPGSGGPEPVMAGMIGMDGRMGLLNVTGKPFSATETRRTVQMLANGAKIETSDSNQLYRDDQGRTRVEQTVDGKTLSAEEVRKTRGTTVIMDPVAHYVAILNRSDKTVHKNPIPAEITSGSVSMAEGKVTVVMGNKSEGPGTKPIAV